VSRIRIVLIPTENWTMRPEPDVAAALGAPGGQP